MDIFIHINYRFTQKNPPQGNKTNAAFFSKVSEILTFCYGKKHGDGDLDRKMRFLREYEHEREDTRTGARGNTSMSKRKHEHEQEETLA